MVRPELAFICATLCLAGLVAGRATPFAKEDPTPSSPDAGPTDAEDGAQSNVDAFGPADTEDGAQPNADALAPPNAGSSQLGENRTSAVRGGRRLFGRLGFLAGLHLGGAISSSGSLSASHSLNVFGKVMNTALSVSYGSNGPFPGAGPGPGLGPGSYPGGPPLLGLQDDPGAGVPSSTVNPNKGYEASALLNLKKTQIVTGDGVSNVKVVVETRQRENAKTPEVSVEHTDSANTTVVGDVSSTTSPTEQQVAVLVNPTASAVTVDNLRNDEEEKEDDEDVGEEPDEPPAAVQLSAHGHVGVGLETSTRVRVDPGPAARRVAAAAEQHRLFLEHHNKHVAAFNNHLVKYNGDVSRVALYARS